MKRFAALAVAVLLFISLASAQTLTKAERDKAIKHLQKTEKMFLRSISKISDAQYNWKPAPERWSVAECAEHLALTEDLIYKMITEQLLKAPAAPEKKAEVAGKDDLVLEKIADRSQKFNAPEMIQPKRTFATRDELVKHFKASRARLAQYVKSTNDDLRVHFQEHPVMKLLDAYQWVLLNSAHTERHTKQILEVKAEAAFPKK
ncbi:MAG TPA: DinB family protein [Candidatus Nitrosotenuis sp.]|nr:DinB family protein [Candidatus Nitrosotenuis sp.]